jgi:plasmid stability protein
MADLLIRDVPDDVAAALSARAARLGMSRSDYIRRLLTQEVSGNSDVSPADLARFAGRFAALADPDVMDRAWQ